VKPTAFFGVFYGILAGSLGHTWAFQGWEAYRHGGLCPPWAPWPTAFKGCEAYGFFWGISGL